MIRIACEMIWIAARIARIPASPLIQLGLGLLIALRCFSAPLPAYGQVTFNGLGLFGGTRSEAHDVSADGAVVVGLTRNEIDSGFSVFRWTDTETMFRPGFSTFPAAVSADGLVVVGTRLSPPQEAFRWTFGGNVEGLGDLPGGGATSSGFGVSGDGSVVVGASTTATGDGAFRWTPQTGMVYLGDLPGGRTQSLALGTSGDGSVVVGYGYADENHRQATRWTAETGMVGLGILPGGFDSTANAVSADGSVVVGINTFLPSTPNFRTEAFRWTAAEGMISLGDLAGEPTGSNALDVSADGSVIVGYGRDSIGSSKAMFWTADTGMVKLQDALLSAGVTNLDGWLLTEARGVSADGKTIVGVGDHDGRMEAWVVTIPEPSTFALGLIAGTGLLGYSVRRYLAVGVRRK